MARFNESRGLEDGATMPAERLWELSESWWGTRLAPDWRPRTRDESQAILDGLGLTGGFWRLS